MFGCGAVVSSYVGMVDGVSKVVAVERKCSFAL